MNREIWPGGVYPLAGDVQSTAGNPTVTVVGLQSVPVSAISMDGGEILEYSIASHAWKPTLRASIQVDRVTVSDDYLITVNVAKPIFVNGA